MVLNLFDEYSDRVYVSSFTVSLFAAMLLQILLKLTIAAEHYVAAFFKARPGGFMTFMRWFSAWVVLFGSKFVILEALDLAFGESVRFEGRFHGLIVLIVVVVVMLVVEELIVAVRSPARRRRNGSTVIEKSPTAQPFPIRSNRGRR